MHSPILTGNQNRRIICYKNGRILIKNVILKFNFQNEGHFHPDFLIYVLTIYRECLLFQLFSRGICMHTPMLTTVEYGHTGVYKNSHIFLEMYF